MSISDPIADMLTKIRNASKIFKESTDIPFSKMNASILDILKKENYIENIKAMGEGIRKVSRVYLKYNGPRDAVITGIKRRSRPGLRVYAKFDEIPYVLRGKGLAVISTSKGIITDKQARSQKIGGEVLFYIW